MRRAIEGSNGCWPSFYCVPMSGRLGPSARTQHPPRRSRNAPPPHRLGSPHTLPATRRNTSHPAHRDRPPSHHGRVALRLRVRRPHEERRLPHHGARHSNRDPLLHARDLSPPRSTRITSELKRAVARCVAPPNQSPRARYGDDQGYRAGGPRAGDRLTRTDEFLGARLSMSEEPTYPPPANPEDRNPR
jgi:hypothetical protein